jgi:hypothetical protein
MDWKQIPSCPQYEASSTGEIRLIHGGRWNRQGKPRKPWLVRGYSYVTLRLKGERTNKQVHRLVAEAFLGPSLLQVNHINGARSDNRIENLEYLTPKENQAHSKNVLKTFQMGERHHNSSLTEAKVREIFALVDKGLSDLAISRVIGCSRPNVSYIRRGEAWAHLGLGPRPPNHQFRS